MSGPVFLVAAAMAAGTLIMIVKTIAAGFAGGRASSSEIAQIRFAERLLTQARNRAGVGPGELGG